MNIEGKAAQIREENKVQEAFEKLSEEEIIWEGIKPVDKKKIGSFDNLWIEEIELGYVQIYKKEFTSGASFNAIFIRTYKKSVRYHNGIIYSMDLKSTQKREA